jgi:hypothetical protein
MYSGFDERQRQMLVPMQVMKSHRGRGDITPFIFNLGTRWSRVAEIYMLATLATLLLKKTFPAPTEWRLCGPIASMHILEKIKISFPSGNQTVNHPANSQNTTKTTLALVLIFHR